MTLEETCGMFDQYIAEHLSWTNFECVLLIKHL